MLFFSFGLLMLATVTAVEISMYEGTFHLLVSICSKKCLVLNLLSVLSAEAEGK